jgi:PAB-dependent poly(A)-specific ribonuclease subunit 3
MASAGKPALEDARRTTGSPKMKSRGERKVIDGPLTSSRRDLPKRDGLSNPDAYAGFVMTLTRSFPENAKETLCRNVTIYGRCRYEDKGIVDLVHAMGNVNVEADLDSSKAALSTMTQQN